MVQLSCSIVDAFGIYRYSPFGRCDGFTTTVDVVAGALAGLAQHVLQFAAAASRDRLRSSTIPSIESVPLLSSLLLGRSRRCWLASLAPFGRGCRGHFLARPFDPHCLYWRLWLGLNLASSKTRKEGRLGGTA